MENKNPGPDHLRYDDTIGPEGLTVTLQKWVAYAETDKCWYLSSESAADIVRNMLAHQGKGLNEDARRRLLAVAEADEGGAIEIDYYRPGAIGDEVWIAHYDVRAAMGGGQIPHDYPEMFQDVRVSPQHLREMGVEFKEHSHLKMVTGWGQSMAEEQQEPTAESLKQKKKRAKKAEDDAKKGVGVFKVEVAGVFMPDLKRLMKEHGSTTSRRCIRTCCAM
ncbi:hypothetical protein [Pseudomonas mucoides]|uniref:hypothetical protein n=1 Tax=Pseudomonas mucoides TaxID=2730424 RepID=UPI001E2DA1BC|nr:hypothetical protein [Pseudomonas mucoides]